MTRTRIGPYEVRAKVGEGGMGEVFKAWDPRLERDVAIKLLHPDSSGNPERQKRLLAEGRAASALNHPNILRVYDADVDGTSYYLVSEWLEGKSLRDELSRGPLPLKRLLDLSVQIADGLAAAHAIGIVHKDIKPENVMLAKDGTARIVDFGLARSTPDGSTLATSAGHATTVSLEGGLSGTPAYMSPEQARGTPGDFRTDQFSFGALMYEMATGTFAFRRDSVADTLAAVLHEEPRPIAEVNPRVPAPFRWMVERCLAKEASERYTATEDLARELRTMRDHWSEALGEPRADHERPAVSRRGKTLGVAAAGAAVGAGVVIALLQLTSSVPQARFTPFASASEYEGAPSWSPDGQSLAYVADVDGVLQIFVRRRGDAVRRQVTQGRFDSQEPFWAIDNRRVYYISLAGSHDALWSVGVAGGRPELVLENVTHAAIDRDGTRLALLRWHDPNSPLRESLWWSSPPGADPTPELRPPFDQFRTSDGQLRFNRNGQLMVWVYSPAQLNPADSQPFSEFYILPTDAGPARRVLSGITASSNLTPFDWLPDGRHVVAAIPDASTGSRHLWLADSQSSARWPITATHTNESDPAVSPDGQRVAYASEEVDFDLVLISPDGQSRQPMLATARNEVDPVWSPSGDQFAFVTDRAAELEIWTRSRDGLWERPVVTASDFGSSRTLTLGALAFSPDGRTLAYQRQADGMFEVWLSPSTGGAPVRLISKPPEGRARPYQDGPTWSPDGEWIAYTTITQTSLSLAKVRLGTNESITLAPVVLPFSRYNAFNKRNAVITPFISTVTPSHSYQYFAHAAPGRRVNEVQVGTYVGTTLDALVPGMFVQGRYGYGIQERFLDISHNRSVFSLEGGYFMTPDVRVFGMVSGQRTHGGFDLTPTSRLTWTDAQWLNHDRIVKEHFANFGAGIGWSVNDVVDVFGSYTQMFSARNTHVLDYGLLFGMSIRVQKSAIERGIVSNSMGNRIARCACQKGLAAKR